MAKLFNTKEDFTSSITGETNVSLEAMEVTIQNVIDKYIIPLMSDAQMVDLLEKIDSEDAMAAEYVELCNIVRRATAHIAMAIATPVLNVRAQVGGFIVPTGENSSIASGERVRQYVESMSIWGQGYLDDLITFLEKHADVFTDYAESDERVNTFSNFINTTAQLHGILLPQPGRWVLQQMKSAISFVEETIIKPTIGNELYDELKDLIATRDGVTATTGVDFGAYAPLIPHIERAVAHYAFAESVDQLGLKVDALHGVYISFYKNANEPQQSKTNGITEMERIKQLNEKRGETAMKALKQELLTNLADYPLYAESTAYTAPEENYTTNAADNGVNGASFYAG